MAIAEIAAGAAAFTGVAQAFTAAGDAFRAWKGLGRDNSPEAKLLDTRLSELFEKYMALQQANAAVQEAHLRQLAIYTEIEKKNAELSKEMARLKAFDADVEKYKLVNVGAGAFCYVAEPVGTAIKEGPYFCAACFERRQRSILQRSKRDFHWDTLRCGQCSGEIMVPNDVEGGAMVSSGGRRIDFDGY